MKYRNVALATMFIGMLTPQVQAATSLPQTSPYALTAALGADLPLVQVKEGKEGKGHKKAEKKAHKNAEKKRKDIRKQREKAEKKRHKELKKAAEERGKDIKKANKHAEKRAKERRKSWDTPEQRQERAETILNVPAPEKRDMTALLAAVPLALLGKEVIFADVPEERLLTYRNCPPGLAKKDPPCVPPGLADKGVTYEQWVSYDDEEIDRLLREESRQYRDDAVTPEDDVLLLSSSQIADLYDLRSAPAGKRYALIDGQPVLLSDEDYSSLLRINDLARVDTLPGDLRIAPTAALTQQELRQTYRLPELEPGYNYAVINGELVTLADSAFETLQLIRMARAVF
ncbi:transketolase [Sulfitobacter aestuarii]|uniref:Transketolase n=1 Tax=Sulfitobacter aestuarii TaxID=2161676 RepID=A0ABW5U1T8_9RHOB